MFYNNLKASRWEYCFCNKDLVLHKPEQSLEQPMIKLKEQVTKQKAVLCKLSGEMALLPPGISNFPLSFMEFWLQTPMHHHEEKRFASYDHFAPMFLMSRVLHCRILVATWTETAQTDERKLPGCQKLVSVLNVPRQTPQQSRCCTWACRPLLG